MMTYLLYSFLWAVVRLLPERAAFGLFKALADLGYRRNSKRVRRLRENYRRILMSGKSAIDASELERLVREGLRNSMRYWCETFRISDWSIEFARSKTTIEGLDNLQEAYASRSGVIVAVPHAGNWDHAGYVITSLGMPVHTVAEHLEPERLFIKFLEHRNRMGMTVLDLDKSPMPELARFLKAGQLVALVSDRDLSKSGIDVKFFGETARMPAGAAALAFDTGAKLLTAFVRYTGTGIAIQFSTPLNVNRSMDRSTEIRRVTQVIADEFERSIAANPESWHMLQRIFVDKDFRSR